MKGRIETVYGYKKLGTSHFVIVAPHGAGDDLGSPIIASRLAFKLKASLVVNTKFKKPANKKAVNPNFVEDFNKLFWSNKIKGYKWLDRKPAMKQFYTDISDYCTQATKKTNDKPTVVYIHSFRSNTIGIDIGIGAKKDKKTAKLEGTKKHPEKKLNQGEVSLKISTAKKIRLDLEKNLNTCYNLQSTIGHGYAGWSRQSAIQYHRHPPQDEYAIQFEINQVLRSDLKNIKYTVNLLSEILKKYL